jgi:hypothetical protein
MTEPRIDSMLRFTRWLVGVGAVATLLFAMAGKAFVGAGVPPVLTYANVGAAVLNLIVAWQLGRGQRAAWAFGLSIAIVLTVVDLLGLSNMLRAGTPGLWSIALEAVVPVQAAMLIAVRNRF